MPLIGLHNIDSITAELFADLRPATSTAAWIVVLAKVKERRTGGRVEFAVLEVKVEGDGSG